MSMLTSRFVSMMAAGRGDPAPVLWAANGELPGMAIGEVTLRRGDDRNGETSRLARGDSDLMRYVD